jgi:hypothetical protein
MASSPACACPFCAPTLPNGPDDFPLPVRITLSSHGHFSAWGWLVANDGAGNYTIDVPNTGSSYTRFTDTLACVASCARRLGVPLSEGQMARYAERIVAKTPHEIGLTRTNSCVLPLTRDLRLCTPPRTLHDVHCMKDVPYAAVAVDGRHKRKRVAARSAPPASPPARVAGSGDTYTLASLGGDTNEIAAIDASYYMWTGDMAHAVLCAGGRPPLLAVERVDDRTVVCTVRDPRGAAVPEVYLKRSMLHVAYPHAYEHLRVHGAAP